MNKKISEMVKGGKTIFKSKIKWILALILLTGCIYGSYTLSRYTEADQVEAKQAQVILDAGHGGSDPGKIGLNNLLEKDINLAITEKVKKCLEKEKITAELTRKEDKGLVTTGDGSKKTEDMQARVKMINETKPVLTVSIHQNSYEDPEFMERRCFITAIPGKERLLRRSCRKVCRRLIRKITGRQKQMRPIIFLGGQKCLR